METEEQRLEKARYFAALWRNKGEEMSVQQKDELAKAYLECIIGEDENGIQQFRQGAYDAEFRIGQKQAGATQSRNDYGAFWIKANELLGGLHSEQDIQWLRQADAEYHVLLHIDPSPLAKNSSGLVQRIHNNAMLYK